MKSNNLLSIFLNKIDAIKKAMLERKRKSLKAKIEKLQYKNNLLLHNRHKLVVEVGDTATHSGKSLDNIYLKNILANLPENFYWANTEGKVLGCNENQARFFGLNSSSELIGKTIFDMAKMLGWDESIPKEVRRHDEYVMRTRKSMKFAEAVMFEGKLKTYLSFKNPLLDDDNNVIGVFGVTVDITEMKEIEKALLLAKAKAEMANEAKNEFLHSVSHDLRTPLNGIIAFCDFLSSKETDAEKKEMLGYMDTSAKALLEMISQIVETTMLEVGEDPVKLSEVEINAFAENVRNLVRSDTHQKGLNLIIDYPKDKQHKVITDKVRVLRIILNLVGNAVKFTESGAITIAIAIKEAKDVEDKSDDKAILEVSVEDTGKGIEAEKQSVIFEKFTRIVTERHRSIPGLGLGLYIVKKFADELNGQVRVESQPGKGSKFICQVPVKLV